MADKVNLDLSPLSEFTPQVDPTIAARSLGVILPGAVSGAVTNLLPDRSLPGAYGYIPFTGLGEGIASTVGGIYDVGRNIASKFGLNLPEATLLNQAGEHFGATQDKVYDVLPHYTPPPADAPAYDVVKNYSQMVGGALPTLPVPASALTALPKAAQIATHLLMPGVAGTGERLAVAGTAGPLMQYALTPDQAEAAQPTPADQPSIASQLGTISSPFSQVSQTDSSNASATQPLDLSGLNIGASDTTTPQGTTAQTQPLFGEEGTSGVSWWKIGAGIAAIVGMVAGARHTGNLGVDVSQMARDARMNDPDYAVKAADYNNAQVAIQSGQQISNAQGGRTLPPLPGAVGAAGDIHNAAVAAQTQTLDSTALARDYINLTSTNPTVAERLANQYGTTFDQGRWQSTLREFLATGKDAQTGITIPAPRELFDDISNLSIPDKKTMIDGLMAANEMDNRNYNYGRGIIGTDAAHDFVNTPDPQLVSYTQQMLANPTLADIANRYWGIGSGLVDIGEAHDFFSAQEAARMKATRPNYVPEVMMNGLISHALGPRNVSGVAGIDQVNTTPWSAMAQHIEQITRQFELNDMARAFTDHQLDLQNNYPNSAQFLKDVPNPAAGQQASLYPTLAPAGASGREPIYSVRRSTGVDFYRSDNPDFYNMIKQQNANRMNAIAEGFGIARRALQLGTTGVMAAATGRAFPITHLTRVGIGMGINRPPGTVGSLSDAIMQRLTGGRVGQRIIPDPTYLPGVAYTFGRGQFDKAVYDLGEMFRPTNPNSITQVMKSIIGPQQMQSISDGLKNYYLGTTTHEMMSAGISGTGIPFKFRPPSGIFNDASLRGIRMQSAQLSPKLFMPAGKTGQIHAHFLSVRDALEQAYGDLMDAGNQYYYRLNKFVNPDIDPNKLTYESRALVGNPSVAGASTTMRGFTGAVPYANIALQGIARRVRAFNETPIGTSTAVAGNLGTLALLSMYTAMRNPQTLQYIQNMVTTPYRAANVMIFGNDDPQYHTEISLPQELRPLYPMMLEIMGKALNIGATIHDPLSYDGVYQFMKDWFSQHVENSTLQSALYGARDAMNFVDVPAVMNTLTSLGGGSVRIDLEQIVNDALNRRFGLGTFYMPLGADGPLPNHPAGDNLFEGADGKKWSALMSHIFGTVGGVFDDAMNLVKYHHDLGDWVAAAGQVGKDWLQKAMDANPELNSLLWENPVRESMRSPIVEYTQRRMENMKAAGGPRNAELMEGTTGGPRPLPVTPIQADDEAAPKDPAMRNLYSTVQSDHAWIQSKFVADINQLKKQMQDAANQPMDNAERRQWMNNQTRVISDKYRIINSFIDDVNQRLSAQYGKRIDIGSPINWKGDMSQFAPLN